MLNLMAHLMNTHQTHPSYKTKVINCESVKMFNYVSKTNCLKNILLI